MTGKMVSGVREKRTEDRGQKTDDKIGFRWCRVLGISAAWPAASSLIVEETLAM
jgi:hypothetical protein